MEVGGAPCGLVQSGGGGREGRRPEVQAGMPAPRTRAPVHFVWTAVHDVAVAIARAVDLRVFGGVGG